MSQYEAVVRVRYVVDDSQVRAAQARAGGPAAASSAAAPRAAGGGGATNWTWGGGRNWGWGGGRAPAAPPGALVAPGGRPPGNGPGVFQVRQALFGVQQAVIQVQRANVQGLGPHAGGGGHGPGGSGPAGFRWPTGHGGQGWNRLANLGAGRHGWRGLLSYLPAPQQLLYQHFLRQVTAAHPGASPQALARLAGMGTTRSMHGILRGGLAAGGIGFGLSLAARQFQQAVSHFGQAADRFVQGITRADATSLLQMQSHGRLAGAYARSGMLIAGGTALGAGVGGAFGGPIGAGIGGVAGAGAGFLAGLPQLLSAQLTHWFQSKLFAALDGLVESVQRYNGTVAAASANYRVAQIRFTMALGQASAGMASAWLNLKVKVLDAWLNALPAMKPAFAAVETYLNGLANAAADAVPEILEFTATLVRAVAWISDHIPSLKGTVNAALNPVGAVANAAAQAAGTALSGQAAPPPQGLAKVAQGLQRSAADLRQDNALARQLRGLSPQLRQQQVAALVKSGRLTQERADAILRQAGGPGTAMPGLSSPLGPGGMPANLLTMGDWRAFFTSHRAASAVMGQLDPNSPEYAGLLRMHHDPSRPRLPWFARRVGGMMGLHAPGLAGIPTHSPQPPKPGAAAAGQSQSGTAASTASGSPAKPPASSSKGAMPKGKDLPAPVLSNQMKWELRLANDKLMHEAVGQMRDQLAGAQRRQENELRLGLGYLEAAAAAYLF